MARFFNTTGPCDPRRHYMLPPEARLPDLFPYIDRQLYFVLHSARQTGKTTAMLAFAEQLRSRGYLAVHATLERSFGMTEVADAEPTWLWALYRAASQQLSPPDQPPEPTLIPGTPGTRLSAYLGSWCARVQKPVVLLLDEADTVSGPAMVSLLRQLRADFPARGPGQFPISIALIGMRDLRDYLTAARDGTPVSNKSPFNIKESSLTLLNFSEADIATLYAQHTEETGQVFTAEALSRAWYWSRGQPFLVNVLAKIAVTELASRAEPVTGEHINEAKERLILARTTHIDSLGERLKEGRVARVVQAVLLGDTDVPYDSDDYLYCVDLGLLRDVSGGTEPANPLYREVLIRELTYLRQRNLPLPWWPWQRPDGSLDMPALVDAFCEWWRENAEMVEEVAPAGYREAVPHISFMAFLQRVVNGGGKVHREYAAGRGAVDLLVEYGGKRHVIELKRVPPKGRSPETVRKKGLQQLSGYLQSLGEPEGWLLIFDQRPGLSWDQRMWREEQQLEGRKILMRGG